MRKPLSRAFNRDKSYWKAKRKKDISDSWRGSTYPESPAYYDNLHQYSKNKIHCSCGMCSRYSKTNNKGDKRGIKGNYAPSYNPSRRDQKRNAAMDADEFETLDLALAERLLAGEDEEFEKS